MSRRQYRRPDAPPAPRVRWAPLKGRTNDAEDAIFLASGYGLIPDDWQVDILTGWLARRVDGKWCYGRCGLAVPRQNGKNGAIEVRELYGMVVLGEAFLHAAHEVKTTRKAFKRLKHFFGDEVNDPKAKYPELNALVAEVRSTNGQEAIFLKDVWEVDGQRVYSTGRPLTAAGRPNLDARFVRKGGSIEFVARSRGSGRGFTVDVLVLDEAQHLNDDELEAIRSAVSSAPLGNPQVIYAGTPPDREKGELGVVWLRVRAGAGKDKRLCWIEYGVPDGPLPDLDDEALLYEVNPALELRHGNGAYGLTMDVVLDEKADLSPEGYARERFGWWGDPQLGAGSSVMPNWGNLGTRGEPPPITALGVAVDVDRVWCALGAAAVSDDLLVPYVGAVTMREADRVRVPLSEVIELEANGETRKVPLIVAEAARIQRETRCVVVADKKGPAGSLEEDFVFAGVEVLWLGLEEVVQACADLFDAVAAGLLQHNNDELLNAAVAAAGWRKVGDRNIWARRAGNIVELEAVTVALHGASHTTEAWGFWE